MTLHLRSLDAALGFLLGTLITEVFRDVLPKVVVAAVNRERVRWL